MMVRRQVPIGGAHVKHWNKDHNKTRDARLHNKLPEIDAMRVAMKHESGRRHDGSYFDAFSHHEAE
jgi:hypothetical protein